MNKQNRVNIIFPILMSVIALSIIIYSFIGTAHAAAPHTIIIQMGTDGYTGAKDQSSICEDTYNNAGFYSAGKMTTYYLRDGSVSNALIYFDLTGQVPAGANIESATLSFYNTRVNSYDPGTCNLYRVIDPDNLGMWMEGNDSDSTQKLGAGWRRRAGTLNVIRTPWTKAANSTIMDSVITTGNATVHFTTNAGWNDSTDLVSDIQAWVNGTAVNQGWYLRTYGSGMNIQDVPSNDYPMVELRPKLTITYTDPTTIPPTPTPTRAPTPTPTPKYIDPGPSSIGKVRCYGNFETAGVDMEIINMSFNETAQIEYKRQQDTEYKKGHYFVRYDGNHMATSLFDLASNTKYDIKITLKDPDGIEGSKTYTTTLKTKTEYRLPTPLRIVNVLNQAALNNAIENAKPGDEIRLAPGAYGEGFTFDGISGTIAHPIVVTSQGAVKPLITGEVLVDHTDNIVINNLEVHNEAGKNIHLLGSCNCIIRKCYIHDAARDTYDILIGHSDEASKPNYAGHLIIDNIISDDDHDPVDSEQGPGASGSSTERQTYYGVAMFDNPGASVTIRGNKIYGVVDGMHTGDEEGQSPVMSPEDTDLLEAWPDQNIDVYDNYIYEVKDDCIETDGHMVNGRFFRNRLGRCQNAISTALVYPGPIFFVRNFAYGFNEQCEKQNVGYSGIGRNMLFYHNTFVSKPTSSYCFFMGEPGQFQDFVYKNNIFYSEGMVFDGSENGEESFHKDFTFDYDLMYTTRLNASVVIYKWAPGFKEPYNNEGFTSLSEFQQATGQELHGVFANPKLNFSAIPEYPADSEIINMEIQSGSPAIDAGVRILGINDNYSGSGPDIGAFEFGIPEPTPTVEPTPTADTDNVPPKAPKVDIIVDSNGFVTGTAEPLSQITVKKGDTILGKDSALANGNFSVSISATNAGEVLSITSADKAGNISEIAEAKVFGLAPPKLNKIDNKKKVISGSAEANSVVTILTAKKEIGSITTGASGEFTFSMKKALAAGTVIEAIARDKEGNISAVTNSVVIDVIPPLNPIVNKVYKSDKTVTGRTSAYAVVSVLIGKTKLGTANARSDGSFTVPIPRQKPGIKLYVYAADSAGNKSKTVQVIIA